MIRRHTAPMAQTSPQQFLAALRHSHLFSAAQLTDLEADGAQTGDVVACVEKLVERQWLTDYQAEQVLAGFGDALTLGQYRILDRLGEGGMAQVYKAEHILMKRPVAMKVIASRPWSDLEHGYGNLPRGYPDDVVSPPRNAAQNAQVDPGAIDRFHHEVQITARLDHPNIVRAYDAAEARGLFFLVMEFVDGIDLSAQVSESGPLPVAVACDYVRQAALGLQYAHERGLVHRDIKPSNLLVTKAGVVKILDLGLARLASAIPSELVGPANGSDLSSLAGTPDYMAPETAQDSRCADIRSDLYSLGCTFYFLLTGQPPFPGGGWPEKLLRHQLDSAPSAVVIRPDVPAEVAAILQRLMAKDPVQRYAAPAELAAELEAWLALHGTSADPAPALLAATADGTSAPTVSLPRPTPVRSHTPSLALPVPDAVSGFSSAVLVRRRRRYLSVPLGITAASIIGLVAALLMRGSADRLRNNEKPDHAGLTPASSPREDERGAFRVEGAAERWDTLAAAVTAAPPGATITIDGNGPFPLHPVRLQGKALTLRAGDGFRPRLQLIRDANSLPWQPLLAANQPLRLEGLELVCEPTVSQAGAETAHLVYVETASLHLTNCLIHAPRGSACVVCRDCRSVRIENSQLTAASLALCVEAGSAETDVVLQDTHVDIAAAHSAGLSLWAAERNRASALALHLDHCTIQAGRGIAFGVLPRQITVVAHHNRFSFQDALVSYASSPDPTAWRRATTWQEADNIYDAGGAAWLQVNGTPAGVRDFRAWRNLWDAPQAGARANVPTALVESADRAD